METIGTLYKQAKSANWSWKVKVPADLAHLPQYLNTNTGKPKQYATAVSLQTSDKAAAQTKAAVLAAEWALRFAQERRQPAPVEAVRVPITPEISEAIAHGVYRKALTQDDALRETPEGMAVLDAVHAAALSQSKAVKALLIPSKTKTKAQESSPLMGLSEGAARMLASMNAQLDGVAAVALTRRHLASVHAQAEEAAAALGLAVDWSSREGIDTLKRCLGNYRKAMQDRTRRDAGDVVETPAPKALPTPTKTNTLMEVFEKWKDGGANPSPDTIVKKRLAVKLYEEFTNNAPIQSLTPEQGKDFEGWLLRRHTAEKTAKNRLEDVKSLLNVATREGGLGWLSENPWGGSRIKVKKRVTRKPWPSLSLVTLFNAPLFTGYALPADKDAGGAAAYWVPLLGIYLGARQSELCQLRVSDVEETDEGLALHITSEPADEDEGTEETSAKTEVSQRRVPVHPALMALGFGDYVRDTKAAGHAALFPDVRRREGQPAGAAFGRWFLKLRQEQGVAKRWVDFHAFRHAAKTRMTDAGVPDSVSDYITGHKSAGGRGSAGTYKHFQDTLSSLEKLQYPELNLKRVYRRNVSEGKKSELDVRDWHCRDSPLGRP